MVPIEALAKLAKAAPRTIRGWVSDGCPHERRKDPKHPNIERLFFDPAAVIEWVESRGREPGKEGRPAALDTASTRLKDALAVAELRFRLARARLNELAVAAREGKLIAVETCTRDWVARVLSLKTGLLALPALFGSTVARAEPIDVERRSMEEIRRVLESFARDDQAYAVPLALIEEFMEWRSRPRNVSA